MSEVWMPVDGYKGLYEVSCSGQVRSLDRTQQIVGKRGSYSRKVKGRILRGGLVGLGYLVVSLGKNGVIKEFYVHRLVATAFVDNLSGKPQVNHKNGNKTDNRVENLEWMTHQENGQHAGDTGLAAIGSRNSSSKLRIDDIPIILRRIEAGELQTVIAKEYGVCKQTITMIKQKKIWRHVEGGLQCK